MDIESKVKGKLIILIMAAVVLLAGCAPKSLSENSILRVAFQPIVQTDPALISSDSEVFIANAVYDYLVDVDAGSNLVPRLATNWKVSDDGLTYTLSLAEGVTFHDGSPFTAEDVVWTYNRLRDPDLGFATSDLYSNIDSIESVDPITVVFVLKTPNPFFLNDLSDNHALMIKNGTVDASDFNGTGPFTVVEYSPEDRIRLAANPDYFISGQPKLAEVDVIFFPDEIAMVDALRGGQVDLVLRMSTSLFESLQGESAINTVSVPTNGFDLIRLRSDREPGNNPLVIQAMKLATDRQAILDLILQGYGAIGNDSPIGPLYDAYYDPGISPPVHDVQAARDLLVKAGYPDGLNLTLHVPDSGDRPDLAAVIQQQWAEANINVDISVEPESVYYGDNGWLDVDLGITGWGSRPYPQFYLDVMLVSNAKWNESHFADSEFDNLARVTGSTLDENERIAAYSRIQQLLADRGPIIIPYYFVQFAAINANFEGFELKAFAGRTDMRTIYLP
ncbi:MAG TPA: ABC transporter substrate-binding protein [Anaerolineales bacterium]|nr:ABC transporter substrate-binding protein [Anaerolineales bacterium]